MGIPNGRFSSLPGLGIQTLRVGLDLPVILSSLTNSIRASGDNVFIPSTPAVFKPRVFDVASSRTNKGFGVDKKGDNAKRFEKIKNRDNYESHRMSKRLADFAHKHGATVIVFECLINLCPRGNAKGERPDRAKFSRRSNQKRAYWLSSKIIKRTKYKAFQLYGIITALVSPKDTSRHCALCNNGLEENSLVSRIEAQFSIDVARLFQITMNKSLEKVDYSTGAPNYICSETIEHRGNAQLMLHGI